MTFVALVFSTVLLLAVWTCAFSVSTSIITVHIFADNGSGPVLEQ